VIILVTTHVLIVKEKTFKIHLNYLFIGTGFTEDKIKEIKKEKKNDITEKRNYYGLLADIARIRKDDKIIFYLERVGFFGVFQAEDEAFMESINLQEKTYLEDNLGMKLLFRVKIKPYEVYSKSISEWEALDKFPNDFQEAQWSLIYRKLRGNRGCTPITELESKILKQKISETNDGKILLQKKGYSFNYNDKTNQIELIEQKFEYQGKQKELENVLLKMIESDRKNKSIKEERLQVYFTKNAGKDVKLEPICGKNNEIIWLGNEVACGVGMQRIDIMTVINKSNIEKIYNLIELKINFAVPEMVDQFKRYLDWIIRYIKDSKKENIELVLVTRKLENKYHKKTGKKLKAMESWENTIDRLLDFKKNEEIKDIKWFEFYFENREIYFDQVNLDKKINMLDFLQPK